MATSPCPPIGEPVLDAFKKEVIVRLAAEGLSRRSAARVVGCAPSTITRTAQRDPEFGADLALAEETLQRNALQTLGRVVMQDKYWRAAAWVVERLVPERFARRRPSQVSAEEADEFDEEVASDTEADAAEASATPTPASKVEAVCATAQSQAETHRTPPVGTAGKPSVQHPPHTYCAPGPSPRAASPLMEAASAFFDRPERAADMLGHCTGASVAPENSCSGVGLQARPKAKKRRRK